MLWSITKTNKIFLTIFNHLKIKFSFEPKYVVSDFQRAQIIAIGESFPQSKILLCWFHTLKNIKNKITFLSSKNSNKKIIAKDILLNWCSLYH